MDLNSITKSITEIENYEIKVCKSLTKRNVKYVLNNSMTECSCKSYEFCKLSVKTCKHLQYYTKSQNIGKVKSVQPNKPIKITKTSDPHDNYYYSFKSNCGSKKTYYLNKECTKCSCESFKYFKEACKHIQFYSIDTNKESLIPIAIIV